jgi:hypothetical protein
VHSVATRREKTDCFKRAAPNVNNVTGVQGKGVQVAAWGWSTFAGPNWSTPRYGSGGEEWSKSGLKCWGRELIAGGHA